MATLVTDPDWFRDFLRSPVHRVEPLEARLAQGNLLTAADGTYTRSAVEDWVQQSLRDRGLAFGAPIPDPDLDPGPADTDAHTRGMLVALRHSTEIALEVARLFGHDLSDAQSRQRELVLLYAALHDESAKLQSLEQSLYKRRAGGLDRASRRVGTALLDRLERSRAHPPWTLGGIWLDEATRLAGLAIDLHERHVRVDDVQVRLGTMELGARMALIEALAGVAWADGSFSPEEKALVRDRISLSGFNWAERRRALKAVESPRDPEALAADIPMGRGRLFVLEQVILGSHADGVLVPEEIEYIRRLSDALGFAPEVVSAVEADVADFYARNQLLLDHAPAGGMMRTLYGRVHERAVDVVRVNKDRLLQEIRETGELSVLLMRAGRGERWTPEERDKVVTQLLDICKTIPTLAIFALPGGGILLPVLIKILPFKILPTAFADDGDESGVVAVPGTK